MHAEDTSRPLAPLAFFLRVIRRVSLASFSFVCSAALLSLLFFVCFAAFLIIIISRFCSSRVEHGSTGMGTSWKGAAFWPLMF